MTPQRVLGAAALLASAAAAAESAPACPASAADQVLLQTAPARLERPPTRRDAPRRAPRSGRRGSAGGAARQRGPRKRSALVHGRAVARRARWDDQGDAYPDTDSAITKLDDNSGKVSHMVVEAQAATNSLVKWQHVGEAVSALQYSSFILSEANAQIEIQLNDAARVINDTKAVKNVFAPVADLAMSDYMGIIADRDLLKKTIKDVQDACGRVRKVVEQSGKVISSARDTKDVMAQSTELAPSLEDVDLDGLPMVSSIVEALGPKVEGIEAKLSAVDMSMRPLLEMPRDGPLEPDEIPILVDNSKSCQESWAQLQELFSMEVKPLVNKAGSVVTELSDAVDGFTPKMGTDSPTEANDSGMFGGWR